MIVFTRSGQLGNQLFQLAFALGQRRRSETIRIADIGDSARCFQLPDGVRTFALRDSTPARLLRALLLKPAAALRLITRIHEAQYDGRVQGVLRTRGLLPIAWIDGGFYQDRQAAALDGFPTFQPDVLRTAEEWLATHCDTDGLRVFCHIRRADYMNFHQTGRNVALPLAYYERALDRIVRDGAARILIATDDIEFAELAFAGRDNVVIVRADPCTSMAIMSLCDAGVVSNSSFSWWPGLIVARRGGHVVAPKNWFGWCEGVCEPSSIEYPLFDWLEVPAEPRAVNDRRPLVDA